jgi:hypothetical protein
VQLFFILHFDLGVPIGAPKLFFTAICFQNRHKQEYKTHCGASPCDPFCAVTAVKTKGTHSVPFVLIETVRCAVFIQMIFYA